MTGAWIAIIIGVFTALILAFSEVLSNHSEDSKPEDRKERR